MRDACNRVFVNQRKREFETGISLTVRDPPGSLTVTEILNSKRRSLAERFA
jgi:hypothetical protein